MTQSTNDGHYWESTRRGAAPLIAGAVGLAALGVGQLFPVRHAMESDLRERSLGALEDAGLVGVQVEFTGQDGRLTGSVASPADVDRAVRAVGSLDGVRVVTDDLRLPAGAGPAPSPSPAAPSVNASASTSPTSSPTSAPSASASTSASASPSASATPSPSASPPGTPAAGGDAAQQVAALRKELSTLPAVEFQSSSTRLTPSGRAAALRAAALLKAYPALKVRVEGYTDDLGDWDVNKGLSTARADAVRRMLIAHGVQGNRLSSFGWSEEHPAVPNTSATNRAKNRRVELSVLP